jgi:hypothetical protein
MIILTFLVNSVILYFQRNINRSKPDAMIKIIISTLTLIMFCGTMTAQQNRFRVSGRITAGRLTWVSGTDIMAR